MATRERLLIIGGDAAGMSAASQAKRQRPDLEVIAFERGWHTSYSACGMPYLVGGLVERADSLIARTPDQFAKQGIEARLRHEVIALDLAARRVTVRRLEEGGEYEESFDHLVIATGARPIAPDLPGINARGVYGLSILMDGIRLREAVDREQPARAVVVGGGYIGLEMAEALVLRGIPVALVEAADQVMSTLDPEMAAGVADALRAAGVELYLNEPAVAFETSDGRVRAVVTPARTLPADLVVLGIGVRPNVELARAAGVDIGPSGAIAVTDRLQTSHPGVWAAGDCVESRHIVSNRPVHIALGTVANKQGRIAGINIGGGYARFPGVAGTAITKFCALEIARTGLSERECRALGIDYVVGRVEGTSRAGYYPEAGTITLKVLAERATGRLLGAQILGTENAAKRIDVFVTALFAGMTVDEFQYLDLSYAPPFSPTWDTPLIAARKAAEALAAGQHVAAPWPTRRSA
ncbi:MAG: FAD-dependent oxidoreductase [Chloroflexota bacterium]|nr:FAD-dependent oxidoreductase [Dehalococcoidia bacterium]MDW8255312.1 FAD-dependent oxidoreductase [Chloroflexota bacterium]